MITAILTVISHLSVTAIASVITRNYYSMSLMFSYLRVQFLHRVHYLAKHPNTNTPLVTSPIVEGNQNNYYYYYNLDYYIT